jgi:hypothetical protein
MDSEKRKRPPNFRLEIPGDENLKNRIQEKFTDVTCPFIVLLVVFNFPLQTLE